MQPSSDKGGKPATGIRNREYWWYLLLVGAVLFASFFGNWRFNHMTVGEHLQAARLALREQQISEGFRHLNALPFDTSEAVELRRELKAAEDTMRQVSEAAHQAVLAAQRQKDAQETAKGPALRDLDQNLRNLGYDLTVARSDNPDEIVITSKDFDDTDHRVRFLSFLRGRKGPAAGACFAGFQTVRLKGSGLLVTFDRAYPLECFAN